MKIKKNYKTLFAALFLAVVAIASYIYYEYNRTNAMSEDITADFKLNAVDLIKEFENDNNISSKKYVGKVLEIKGSMLELEDDHSGNYIMILGSDSIMSKIRCNMDSTYNLELLKSFSKNQQLSIKGICTGYNPDDMGLGADVLLNKCLITSK
ncbi:MAG: OB-fold protein [Chitinophagaceae bacterium]